jgi:cytochrome c oxidase subunit 1
MASMTETRPAPTATPPIEAPPQAAPVEPSGISGWLTTADHQRIGRLWVVTSLLFLIVAGVLGALLGIEQLQSGVDVFGDRGTFGQVYTLAGEVTVLLFLVPLLLGIATAVVPLQVGAGQIAFPRGAAAAFWLHLVSGGVLVGSYLADGGPTGGSRDAADLWVLAVLGLLLASVIALVCLLTTVLALRAPGLTLLRTPAFSWSVLVGGSLTLLTAPVLGSRLIDMYVSHHFGGDFGPYDEHVAWLWSVPQVYLLVVPVVGIAIDVVVTLARTKPRVPAAGHVLVGLAGIVGIGAWAQLPVTFDDLLYVAIGIAAVLPPLAVLGFLADTLRNGRPTVKASLLFAMGSVLLLLLGAGAGALSVIDGLDLQGTVWEIGQARLVLLGAGALGGLGALWWWAPKLWGTTLPEGLGFVSFLATFGGALLLGVPDLVNGLANDLPSRAVEFDGADSIEALSGLSAAGGVLVALGGLVAVLALLQAARRRGGDPNPWTGDTPEWTGEVTV